MLLLRSWLLKLSHRPATVRIFLVLAAFVALIYITLGVSARGASGTEQATLGSMLAFPGAHVSLAGMLLTFCGMAGAAYAGIVAGSEWTWNTFRVALARGESRSRYIVGLYVAIGLLALAGWLALYLLGVGIIVVAGMLGATPVGNPFDPASLGTLGVLVAAGAWAVLMEIAIGFSVSFVARSSVAGIAAVVGLFFVEQLGATFVPADVLRFAPITAAAELVRAAWTGGLGAALAPPLAITTAYLLGAVGVAGLVARRAEVA